MSANNYLLLMLLPFCSTLALDTNFDDAKWFLDLIEELKSQTVAGMCQCSVAIATEILLQVQDRRCAS